MGLTLGYLPHHERRADPLVLHRQLRGRGLLPVRWARVQVSLLLYSLPERAGVFEAHISLSLILSV